MTRVASLHAEQPRGIVFDVKNATPPLERALRKGNYHTRLCTRFFAESDLFDPGRWLSPGDSVLPTQAFGFFWRATVSGSLPCPPKRLVEYCGPIRYFPYRGDLRAVISIGGCCDARRWLFRRRVRLVTRVCGFENKRQSPSIDTANAAQLPPPSTPFLSSVVYTGPTWTIPTHMGNDCACVARRAEARASCLCAHVHA
jgi:hypothetical protein